MSNTPSADVSAKVRRYCPKCGSGYSVTAEQAERQVTCPNCKSSVKLFSVDSPPTTMPPAKKKDGMLTALLVAAVSLAGGIIVLGFGFLVTGYDMGTVFVSILLMLIGNLLIILTVERHGKVVKLQNQLEQFDLIKQGYLDGIEKWNGFERSYSNIKRDIEEQAEAAERTYRDKLRLIDDEISRKTADADEALKAKMTELDKKWLRKLDEVRGYRDATQAVANKYIRDMVSWVMKNVTPNNYATSKDKISKAIDFVRKKGGIISAQDEKEINDDLKEKYTEAVRKQAAKEEQDKIREKIREEQKAQAEIDRELKRLENERAAIEAAIQKALERTHDEHSAEVEELRQKLSEAEAKSQRAISMAQQTKAGNVYVISNIGSFGQNVFKIGMTRRLQPLDRIKELGDASVPFSFDVHMMISCDDAPKLENTLHRELHHMRLNKVNHRKEFFRVSIDDIREIVEANHGTVEYTVDPEALEYFESQKLGDADLEFVERVLDEFDEDDE